MKINFVLANSDDPYEMLHCGAFPSKSSLFA